MRGVVAIQKENEMSSPKNFVSAKIDESPVDPIERKEFNIRRGRKPNPVRMARISFFAQRQAEYDQRLAKEVREAIKTGHSYRQVADAAGVSVSVVQRIMRKERS